MQTLNYVFRTQRLVINIFKRQSFFPSSLSYQIFFLKNHVIKVYTCSRGSN